MRQKWARKAKIMIRHLMHQKLAVGEGTDTVAQLQQLAQMHDSGVLTDEEFSNAKQKLLAGG